MSDNDQKELPQRLKNELATNIVPDYQTVTFKHSVNIGDLWGAMGAMKQYYDLSKRKIIVAQVLDMPGHYYPNAVHPTVSENGTQVTMNQKMWEMCKPLVEHQEYIHSFEKYEGQNIHVDLDIIRQKTFVNLPHGALPAWIPYAYPDLIFNMSVPWMFVNGDCPEHIYEQVKGKVIINFTERYRNQLIDYFFLKPYAPDLIFAGTEREHFIFCQRWGLNIPRLQVNDFLELAYAARESRFVLCNQSQLWNLCEACKFPRLLEVCQYAQNCQIMIGEDSYGFFHQVGVEYLFRNLYSRTITHANKKAPQ